MIIDIVLLSILIVIMALGYRYGFIYTFFHVLGWFISLGCGFFFSPGVKAHLIEADYFYTRVYEKVLEKIPGGFSEGSFESNGIPSLVTDFVTGLANSVTENIAQGVTDLIMTMISFLIVVLLVKLVLFFIIAGFSKKNNPGATGIIDGILGLGFGFIKGMIVLYIILAFMIPIINLASPEHTFSLLTSLDSSVIAKDLYNNNPILLLTNQL